MAWWRRRRLTPEPPKCPLREDVLVISDIHLGEDILQEGPPHLAEYIRTLNLNLAQFIEHHRTHAEPDRRYHLVINGDMFDFVKVSLRPDDEDTSTDVVTYAHALRAHAQLPNTAQNVAWKLSRILEIHRPLFREMARFVAQGHRVTIIEGNHDAEFYFREVRETLSQELVRLAQVPQSEQTTMLGRIEYRSWFVADGGHYHIEHGHQYDQYCSFEYNLAPIDEREDGTLATPLSHQPMPYFAELLGDFSTHAVHTWSALRVFRFLRNLGLQSSLTLFRLYFVVGTTLLRRAGKKRRQQLLRRMVQHKDALQQLVQNGPYGLKTLVALDALKAIPAEYGFFKMLHLFYFDRVVVALCTVSGAALAASLRGAWAALLAGAVGATTGYALSFWRRDDIRHVLRAAAARIADISGARFVVFGHSHAPEVVNLTRAFGVGLFGQTSYYLNGGSWVTREILLGEAGEGMTYVEINAQGAALKRWRGLGEGKPPVVLQHAADRMATEGNIP